MVGKNKIRVAFFEQYPFHAHILTPIFEACQPVYDCLYTSDIEKACNHKPHIIFVSSKPMRILKRLAPHALLIWTRHGITSKNFFETCVVKADIALMSSRRDVEQKLEKKLRPKIDYWVTGFPPLDLLHQQVQRSSASKQGTTLLYAPTFETELSAEPILGFQAFSELLEKIPTLTLTIKPHPHTQLEQPDWMKSWEKLKTDYPERVILHPPETDVFVLYADADLLLSDVSSSAFFYLVLDRPLILVNNPLRFKSTKYNEEGIEWTHRYCADQVNCRNELLETVLKCIKNPDMHSKERNEVAEVLFGNSFDGHCIDRLLSHMEQIVDEGKPFFHYGFHRWIKNETRALYLRLLYSTKQQLKKICA